MGCSQSNSDDAVIPGGFQRGQQVESLIAFQDAHGSLNVGDVGVVKGPCSNRSFKADEGLRLTVDFPGRQNVDVLANQVKSAVAVEIVKASAPRPSEEKPQHEKAEFEELVKGMMATLLALSGPGIAVETGDVGEWEPARLHSDAPFSSLELRPPSGASATTSMPFKEFLFGKDESEREDKSRIIVVRCMDPTGTKIVDKTRIRFEGVAMRDEVFSVLMIWKLQAKGVP